MVMVRTNNTNAKTGANQRDLFIVKLLVNYKRLCADNLTTPIINGDDINTNTHHLGHTSNISRMEANGCMLSRAGQFVRRPRQGLQIIRLLCLELFEMRQIGVAWVSRRF